MDQDAEKNPADASDSLESLESTTDQPTSTTVDATNGASADASPPPTKKKGRGGLRGLLDHFNIYLLLFILVMVIAGVIVAAAFVLNKRQNNVQIKGQTLTQSTLQQLANSDVTVGAPKQVLNVQSNAVFAGKVLINSGLEVAGGLNVGGHLTIQGLAASGTSTFDTVQINQSLSVASDTGIQGQLTVQKDLSVLGSGTFGSSLSAPQITAGNLTLNGNLSLTHHITFGGATPGHSSGSALGTGGTSSVNGSDTAGSININTGGATVAGCFTTITFNQKFSSTPHVLVTPVGSSAAGIPYYVNRSTSSLSVCTTSPAPTNASFGFDYLVLD